MTADVPADPAATSPSDAGAASETGGAGEAVVFEPIGRETLSGRIRDQLAERISTGELGPGTQIPSERALSEQFQVARTSVREALQGLVSLGVIERRGNRSYVAERLPDVALTARQGRTAFVRHLFETRRSLELPIIRLAAQRADAAQRSEIHDLARRFHAGMDVGEFRRLDRSFHAAIARATGNPLLVEMYGRVLSHLFDSDELEGLLTSDHNRREVAEIIDEASRHHVSIAAAIISGDPVAAESCGAGHLDAVERDIIDKLN